MLKKIIFTALAIGIVLVILFRNQIVLSFYYARFKRPEKVEKMPLPRLNSDLKQELTDYLNSHFTKPVDYVISKFKDHQIVFLGEMHRVQHDALLVQQLIPQLYKHHIYNLAIEFATHRDQPLIDSLLQAKEYNPKIANQILFNHNVTWSYREYADLFKVAWQVNHTLARSEQPFRIIGLNMVRNWSYVRTEEDLNNPQVMAKVFPEGRNGDAVMAKNLIQEVVAKKQKALVYCGLHHAFTQFKQPISTPEGHFDRFIEDRMGNIVYNRIGKRAFTICLHQIWDNAPGGGWQPTYPVNGYIDALMHELGPKYYPVGFDTHNSPFGKLPCSRSSYKFGYKRLTLADVCDGYIFTKPFSQYQRVRHIKGFINKNNVEQARLRLSNLKLKNNFFWKILSPSCVDSLMYSDAFIETWLVYFY